VVVLDLKGEGHAVASVRLAGHWLILDNQETAIVEDINARTYRPRFVINESGVMEYSDRPLPVSAPERNNKGPVVAIAAQPSSMTASKREASELFGVAPDQGQEVVERRPTKAGGARAFNQGALQGFAEVIDALPDLLRRFQMIVGDDNDLNRLAEEVKSLGPSEQITFAGKIPKQEKVSRYYA
jgi:hypothetical protein